MRVIRKALSVSGAVSLTVLDRLLGYKPGAKAAPWVDTVASGTQQFCPHREHMRQAAKLQRDEEDRRRRNWGMAAFSHSRS